MIPELRYTPKRKNKIPEWILTACTVLMIACVLFMMFSVGRKLIWEVLFLLGAVVAIWVATRYLTSSFTYTIDYEHRWFLVTQRQGKRLSCLCRLDLASLYLVRPYEERDKDAPRATRYAYCVTPNPHESYLLFFRQEEKTVSVRIECDAAFLTALQDASHAAAVAAQEGEDGVTGQDDQTSGT